MPRPARGVVLSPRPRDEPRIGTRRRASLRGETAEEVGFRAVSAGRAVSGSSSSSGFAVGSSCRLRLERSPDRVEVDEDGGPDRLERRFALSEVAALAPRVAVDDETEQPLDSWSGARRDGRVRREFGNACSAAWRRSLAAADPDSRGARRARNAVAAGRARSRCARSGRLDHPPLSADSVWAWRSAEAVWTCRSVLSCRGGR